MLKRVIVWGGGILLAGFLLIQLVPYGRAHDDPPVTKAAQLPPAAAKIMANSCGDCHSNLTSWPWYSNVAPMSWLVQHDVDEGRSKLNFSEWDRAQPGLDEVSEKIASGEMPPSKYTLIHSGTSLNSQQKTTLIAGMRQLYATDPPPRERGGGGDD